MMTKADSEHQPPACQSEEIAAYLDGELEAHAVALFEEHVSECASCAAELLEQRRLLCTLDFALHEHQLSELQLPKNFSEIVIAHAQSGNLGSLRREPAERGRALRLCLALAIASFALLGGAALSESVLKPVGLVVRHAGTLFGFIGRALYDFGAGVAIIARGVGGHTIFESQLLTPLVFLLLLVALVLLSRLISSYHRTHITLEDAASRVEHS
ncbi:MAG TPA: zf-HC2 domain-containing protein [Pyrinomonadaceae bacterium]|jgi:predicted anti-sigma-YlaC factor YlaD